MIPHAHIRCSINCKVKIVSCSDCIHQYIITQIEAFKSTASFFFWGWGHFKCFICYQTSLPDPTLMSKIPKIWACLFLFGPSWSFAHVNQFTVGLPVQNFTAHKWLVLEACSTRHHSECGICAQSRPSLGSPMLSIAAKVRVWMSLLMAWVPPKVA